PAFILNHFFVLIRTILISTRLPYTTLFRSIFLWLKTPKHYDGETFETYLLKEKSILVAPGVPFGEHGRHYVRISLAVDDEIRTRSEEHTSELQSRFDLVCRLLLKTITDART